MSASYFPYSLNLQQAPDPETLRDDAIRAARELVHAAHMYRRGGREITVRVLLREAANYVLVARGWNLEHVRRMRKAGR